MVNSLEIQREYFELALRVNPDDETIRFSLAAVLKDLGENQEAYRMYVKGLDHLNDVWLSKIFSFTLISGAAALILRLLGVKSIYVLAFVFLLGPFFWAWIRRNRRKCVPELGYSYRESTVQSMNLANKVERLKQMLKDYE